MSEIIELPEVLANQIAAGEVVERPASVVKELVENAIDAGASKIDIQVEEAGLKSILIIDNGEGIAPDQVELALRRHATSKIKSQADLFRIRSLGFRGEALPSIASVSHLTIETAREGAPHGLKLVSQGGQIQSKEPLAKFEGTKIWVEDLFFNTPARLKYMKSQQAELAHIVDVVNRLSLGHPHIAFSLLVDGRQMSQTSGSGDLKQAIAGIYGLTTAKKMLEISAQDLDFQVSGYVSLPELTRANRNYISILINGRYIKNFLLNRAILDGYGSKLMVGRFPLAIIQIEIDPYLADVNVHPTKQEVRISKEKELMTLISQAISQALQDQTLIPDALDNLAKAAVKKGPKPVQTSLPLKENPVYFERPIEKEEQEISLEVKEASPLFFSQTKDEEREEPRASKSPSVHLAKRQDLEEDREHPGLDSRGLKAALDRLDQEEASAFPELEYFGQMHGTYLFAQGREGLFIIDQHAAQERVKYEEYRESIGQVDASQQQLLLPYLFEFSADQILKLEEKKEHLEAVGIYLETYGPNQLLLRQHPIWMKEEEMESAVYEMCDMLLANRSLSVKDYRAELAIMMSCKRSIKANHALDDYSARHLLGQLSLCKNPYNCPHGRPVLVHFSKGDMEKMFRRIQENHTSLRELGKYES